MTTHIVIASTSFLLPKNNAWRTLKSKFELSFAEYGDYNSALVDTPATDIVTLIIFLQDICGRQSSEYLDIENVAHTIFHVIEGRLQATSSPVIVAYSAWAPVSVVAEARTTTQISRLASVFILEVEKLKGKHKNFYAIALDPHLGRIGYGATFDLRNWYFAHCRLSLIGLQLIISLIDEVLERIYKPRRKVLVLDCDNTLWGGVVGEDGPTGLMLGTDGLGAAFTDFQYEIRALARKGVLLALSSKNEDTDVWSVFENNPFMIIKSNEIISSRINWRDKHLNLIEIAQELDLCLDAFVFWDDNPVERELVRTKLPMVEVVDVPSDVMSWPSMLSNLRSLQVFNIAKEDNLKTSQYQARAKFSSAMAKSGDKTDFLRSIGMKPKVSELSTLTLQRAHQLVSKTNQFNLRNVRYSLSELEMLIEDVNAVAINGSLSDSFGDHGIVSLAIARLITADVAFLDSFLMSCRVLGRYFEYWMLSSLMGRLRESGVKYLVAEHIPTSRNAMCKYIVTDAPFVSIDLVPDINISRLNLPLSNLGSIGILDAQTVKFPLATVFHHD